MRSKSVKLSGDVGDNPMLRMAALTARVLLRGMRSAMRKMVMALDALGLLFLPYWRLSFANVGGGDRREGEDEDPVPPPPAALELSRIAVTHARSVRTGIARRRRCVWRPHRHQPPAMCSATRHAGLTCQSLPPASPAPSWPWHSRPALPPAPRQRNVTRRWGEIGSAVPLRRAA